MQAHGNAPKAKSLGTKLVVFGFILFLVIKMGWDRILPYEYWRTNRFHTAANKLANKQGQAAEDLLGKDPDTATIRRASRIKHVGEIEHSDTDYQIDNVVLNCPDNEVNDHKGFISMELTTCDVNRNLRLVLSEEHIYVENIYAVTLFNISPDKNQRQVPAEPVIKVVNPNDGFAIARKVTLPDEHYPEDGRPVPVYYILKGKVNFVNKGEAQKVEVRLTDIPVSAAENKNEP